MAKPKLDSKWKYGGMVVQVMDDHWKSDVVAVAHEGYLHRDDWFVVDIEDLTPIPAAGDEYLKDHLKPEVCFEYEELGSRSARIWLVTSLGAIEGAYRNELLSGPRKDVLELWEAGTTYDELLERWKPHLKYPDKRRGSR